MNTIVRLAALVCVSLMTGCVGVSILESQSKLEERVRDLYIAQGLAFAAAQGNDGTPLASATSAAADPSLPTVRTARLLLAESAERDLEYANDEENDLGPLDKISFAYRAAIKGWHAAEDGMDAVTGAIDLGGTLCDQQKEDRPDRDCDLFLVAEALNIAETAQAGLNPIQIDRLKGKTDYTGADVAEVLSHIVDLRMATVGLGDKSLKSDKIGPLLKPFVNQQLIIYWCHAAKAEILLARLPKPDNDFPNGWKEELDALLLDERSRSPESPEYQRDYAKLIALLEGDDREAALKLLSSATGAMHAMDSEIETRGFFGGAVRNERLSNCLSFATDVQKARNLGGSEPPRTEALLRPAI